MTVRPEWFVLSNGGSLQKFAYSLSVLPFFGAFALGTVVLVRRFRSIPDRLARREIWTILGAVLLYLPYALSELTASALSRCLKYGWPWAAEDPVAFLVHAGSLCLLLVGVGTLLAAWLASTDPETRRQAAFLLSLAGFSLVLGAFAAYMVLYGGAINGLRLQGPLRLIAAAIIAYGILKHQLFGIDLKIKWTLDKGALLAIFGGVFFVVDQAAQFFVSDAYGALAGVIAALLLVFALAPLRKITHRLVDRAMPHVQSTPEYFAERRATIYRATAQSAARDGRITDDERSMLEALRHELGMEEEEARAIEREAMAG